MEGICILIKELSVTLIHTYHTLIEPEVVLRDTFRACQDNRSWEHPNGSFHRICFLSVSLVIHQSYIILILTI